MEKKQSITTVFHTRLFYLMVAALVVTFAISYTMQTRQAIDNAHGIIARELSYLCDQTQHSYRENALLKQRLDEDLINKAETFGLLLQLQPRLTFDMNLLERTVKNYGLLGVDITDDTGMVVASYPSKYIGNFNFAEHEATRQYLPLIHDHDKVVNEKIRASVDRTEGYVKSVGISRPDQPGIVQVRFPANEYQRYLNAASTRNLLTGYTIGETGSVVLLDNYGNIESATDQKLRDQNYILLGLDKGTFDKGDTGFFNMKLNGQPVIAGYDKHEDYTLVAFYPQKEAYARRNAMLVWDGALYLTLFALIYLLISMLLKTTLVKNIFTINHSLGNITKGQLDEKVRVQDYQEFAILSDGINSTVEALKKAIADAAARIDAELEFARAIQTSSLPAVFPPWPDLHDFDIYASMHTAKEVGGDFYDFFLVGDKLAFVMADVSGKGIPAALFMMTARTQIKNHILSEPDLATAFNKVNDALCENNEENMFVTVFAGLLDYKTGTLEFVNAGHNKPLLKHGGTYAWLSEHSGMPMGCIDGQHYKLKTTHLAKSDILYTYTDGVTEAVDEKKELYGDPRLLEFVNAHPTEDVKELLENVLADVKQFAGTAEQADDITMLAVRKN